MYKGLDYAWRLMASGGTIFGLTTLLTYPLDLIHTRMASDISLKGYPRLYASTFECFSRTLVFEKGMISLYKGWEMCLVGSVVRGALTLPLYSMLKDDRISEATSQNPTLNNLYNKIGVSFLTSTVLSLVVYPFDTIKRCMQVHGSMSHRSDFKNIGHAFRHLMVKKQLYKGISVFFVA